MVSYKKKRDDRRIVPDAEHDAAGIPVTDYGRTGVYAKGTGGKVSGV